MFCFLIHVLTMAILLLGLNLNCISFKLASSYKQRNTLELMFRFVRIGRRCSALWSFNYFRQFLFKFSYGIFSNYFIQFPFAVPWAPGGSKFTRNPPPPEGVRFYFHIYSLRATCQCKLEETNSGVYKAA